ncbi:MAG: hypothetical protein S4CHLAM45_10180 [Chlamydiales bacterium]|nr:hypothetical protein [Chlamydiales bacterium]MCH9620166.1 hypothetical protein [Chlamydiales bacterium]MCH9623119.1 hypothetical protein [Chlamydiales bacterium]
MACSGIPKTYNLYPQDLYLTFRSEWREKVSGIIREVTQIRSEKPENLTEALASTVDNMSKLAEQMFYAIQNPPYKEHEPAFRAVVCYHIFSRLEKCSTQVTGIMHPLLKICGTLLEDDSLPIEYLIALVKGAIKDLNSPNLLGGNDWNFTTHDKQLDEAHSTLLDTREIDETPVTVTAGAGFNFYLDCLVDGVLPGALLHHGFGEKGYGLWVAYPIATDRRETQYAQEKSIKFFDRPATIELTVRNDALQTTSSHGPLPQEEACLDLKRDRDAISRMEIDPFLPLPARLFSKECISLRPANVSEALGVLDVEDQIKISLAERYSKICEASGSYDVLRSLRKMGV